MVCATSTLKIRNESNMIKPFIVEIDQEFIPISSDIINMFINSNLPYAKVNMPYDPILYGKLRVYLHRNPQRNVKVIKRKDGIYLYKVSNI